VTVHVVDPLEVVQIDHQHCHRPSCRLALCHRGPQALLEGSLVVQAGEGIALSAALEPHPDLGVVEREGERVREALRELDLLAREASTGRPRDVERPLVTATRDEGEVQPRSRRPQRPLGALVEFLDDRLAGCPPDGEGVVWDDLRQHGADALEQRLGALFGEHRVKDSREPPVRVGGRCVLVDPGLLRACA
jgi:hypothetical protein